jgi:RIO kinase 1
MIMPGKEGSRKIRRFKPARQDESVRFGTSSQREWLDINLTPLRGEWITDILQTVKSGKEATVYCCAAHPSTGVDLLAAKVYRPYVSRMIKNDAIYREGRSFRDKGYRRAIERGSRWGRQVQISSWIEHEFQTLSLFHDVGVDVPAPYTHVGHTILMEYLGDENNPAPMLSRAQLSAEKARPLFERILQNVERMLACGYVHADLSAYNILYWKGKATIIDLPQAVDAYRNQSAFFLLHRDIDRLYRFFQRHRIEAAPFALADEMWKRYILKS